MAKVKNLLTEEEEDLFSGLDADEVAEFNQNLDEKDVSSVFSMIKVLPYFSTGKNF